MAQRTDITEAARKWADSQNLSYDDPRVQKYMASTAGQTIPQKVVEEELLDEEHEGGVDFDAGQRYARDNGDEFDWQDTDDERFKNAVMHYAESQGVDLNDTRVIKYAKGLRSRTGDFGGREQETQVGARK